MHICPLYKAALITSMGKHYTDRPYADGATFDSIEITGCDTGECAVWDWRREECGLNPTAIEK